METYDAVIIGGGHNGMVCATYLAKKGLRVMVLEQRSTLGGACVTEELAGCKVSRTSYVYSLFSPKIVNDFRLQFNGLKLLERDPPSFTPLLDGRYLAMYQDMNKTTLAISEFSKRDADMYPLYEATLDRLVKFIEPLLHQTPPNPLSMWGWPKLLKLGSSALKLKGDLAILTELFTMSAYDFVTKYFESEPLISTLCTDGIIGSCGGPMAPGTAYVLLHHVMGEVNGHRGRWGYVEGGMGNLINAILRVYEMNGGEYTTNADVAQILVRDNRAMGVILKNGRIINAKIVISSADPYNTFSHLLNPGDLPEGFNSTVAGIDYRSASSKVNLVIGGELKFNCYSGKVPGTFHICENTAYMEKAADVAKYGKIPDDLVLEGCIPSVVDDTLAPMGKHVVSLLAQYTPSQLSSGSWESRKSELAQKVFTTLSKYTNLNELDILAFDVLTPRDLETEFRLTGGNLFHGAMNLSRLFCFRPALGYADYRTPISGLYLCGSGTHPGGGVTGLPGHNAAHEVLRDKKFK